MHFWLRMRIASLGSRRFDPGTRLDEVRISCPTTMRQGPRAWSMSAAKSRNAAHGARPRHSFESNPPCCGNFRKILKGNPLEVARFAGIQAAKRTSELIPMCHPLMLSHVDVEVRIEKDGVRIIASAGLNGPTGVEMEALTAATSPRSRCTT